MSEISVWITGLPAGQFMVFMLFIPVSIDLNWNRDIIGSLCFLGMTERVFLSRKRKMKIAANEDAKLPVSIYAAFYSDYLRFTECPGYGKHVIFA